MAQAENTHSTVNESTTPEPNHLRDRRKESAMDLEGRDESIRELGRCLDRLDCEYVSELQRAISDYVIGLEHGRNAKVKSFDDATPILVEIMEDCSHEDFSDRGTGAVRKLREPYSVAIMSPWAEDDSRECIAEAIIRCTPRELVALANAVHDGIVNRGFPPLGGE